MTNEVTGISQFSEEHTVIDWVKLEFLPLLLSLYVNKDMVQVYISPPVYRKDLCEGSDTCDQVTMRVDRYVPHRLRRLCFLSWTK